MNWILIANTGNYSYTTDLIQLTIIGIVLLLSLIGVVEIIRRTIIKVDELEEEREGS